MAVQPRPPCERARATRGRATAVVLALVLTAVGGFGSASSASEDSGGGTSSYVALGDSYSSGEGLGPFYADSDSASDQCHRSVSGSYPAKVASALVARGAVAQNDWLSAACSGNVVDNLLTGVGGNQGDQGISQLTWLSPSTRFATLTIGGNDVRFADILSKCVFRNGDGVHLDDPSSVIARPWDASSCSAILSEATNTLGNPTQFSSALRTKLRGTYDDILRAAPNATLAVATYPWIFPAPSAYAAKMVSPVVNGKTTSIRYCQVGNVIYSFGVRNTEVTKFRKIQAAMNQSIRLAVGDLRNAGYRRIRLVDLANQSSLSSHTITCGDASRPQPYISGVLVNVDATIPPIGLSTGSFHPTVDGNTAFEPTITKALTTPVTPMRLAAPATTTAVVNKPVVITLQANGGTPLARRVDDLSASGYGFGVPQAPDGLASLQSDGNRMSLTFSQQGTWPVKFVAVDANGQQAFKTVKFVVGPPQASASLAWAKLLGSNALDVATAVTANTGGNAIAAGVTCGSLPGSPDGAQTQCSPFVTSYDASGTQLWVRQLASTSGADANGVATDAQGNIYLVGSTDGTIGGASESNAGSNGTRDAFLAKLDSQGNPLWVHQFGTPFDDWAASVAVDVAGNAYITGATGATLPGSPEPNPQVDSTLRTTDVFVAKYDAGGSRDWIHQLGSQANDLGSGIAIGGGGNVLVAGTTAGTLPGAIGAAGLGESAFVARYDGSGTIEWVRETGSDLDDHASSVAADREGNVYVAGTGGPLPGSFDFSDRYDAFLLKYDPLGNEVWVHQLGGLFTDSANGVAVDANDNIYIAGSTHDTLPGSSENNAGLADAFIARYDTSGNRLWVHQIGSVSDDRANGVAVGRNGDVYVAGSASANVASSPDANAGGQDALIAMFVNSG